MNIPDYLLILLQNLKTMNEEQALFATVMQCRKDGWRAEAVIFQLQELLRCRREKATLPPKMLPVTQTKNERERFCYRNPNHTSSHSSAMSVTLQVFPIYGKRKTSESPA